MRKMRKKRGETYIDGLEYSKEQMETLNSIFKGLTKKNKKTTEGDRILFLKGDDCYFKYNPKFSSLWCSLDLVWRVFSEKHKLNYKEIEFLIKEMIQEKQFFKGLEITAYTTFDNVEEPELKIDLGKWYKIDFLALGLIETKYLYFINKLDYKKIYGYGFDLVNKEWRKGWLCDNKNITSLRLSDESESTELLTNEAFRRGFSKGHCSMREDFYNKRSEAKFSEINGTFYQEGDKLLANGTEQYFVIMNNGIWSCAREESEDKPGYYSYKIDTEVEESSSYYI